MDYCRGGEGEKKGGGENGLQFNSDIVRGDPIARLAVDVP